MKKLFLIGILLCSAIILVGAQDGFATPIYEEMCINCHGSGFGSPLHAIHTGQACTICHPGAAGALPIPSSTCIVCHPPADPGLCPLINDSRAGAAHGENCLSCHVDCRNPQPPANDDCENATSITILPFTAFSNTREATPSTDDPTDCYGTNASVWYKLTSITDIRIQVDTSSSNYDTVVAVYEGTCGSFNLIACSDNPCLTLDVRAGVTYYFMVTSWYDSIGSDLVFSVDVAPPPPPPLTIDLQVDPVNFVNNGITTVSGTMNSSAPLDYGYVEIQVRQKAGRVFITGYGSSSIYIDPADGVARWTVQVSGDIGPFKAGKVTVSTGYAYGCTYGGACDYGICANAPAVSTTVRLQNSKQ